MFRCAWIWQRLAGGGPFSGCWYRTRVLRREMRHLLAVGVVLISCEIREWWMLWFKTIAQPRQWTYTIHSLAWVQAVASVQLHNSFHLLTTCGMFLMSLFKNHYKFQVCYIVCRTIWIAVIHWTLWLVSLVSLVVILFYFWYWILTAKVWIGILWCMYCQQIRQVPLVSGLHCSYAVLNSVWNSNFRWVSADVGARRLVAGASPKTTVSKVVWQRGTLLPHIYLCIVPYSGLAHVPPQKLSVLWGGDLDPMASNARSIGSMRVCPQMTSTSFQPFFAQVTRVYNAHG